jgi:hypothetical protein
MILSSIARDREIDLRVRLILSRGRVPEIFDRVLEFFIEF